MAGPGFGKGDTVLEQVIPAMDTDISFQFGKLKTLKFPGREFRSQVIGDVEPGRSHRIHGLKVFADGIVVPVPYQA